jgi:hypothetical protein
MVRPMKPRTLAAKTECEADLLVESGPQTYIPSKIPPTTTPNAPRSGGNQKRERVESLASRFRRLYRGCTFLERSFPDDAGRAWNHGQDAWP